jgi:hypothetical protein
VKSLNRAIVFAHSSKHISKVARDKVGPVTDIHVWNIDLGSVCRWSRSWLLGGAAAPTGTPTVIGSVGVPCLVKGDCGSVMSVPERPGLLILPNRAA